MRVDIRSVLFSILDSNEDMLLDSVPGVGHRFINPAPYVEASVCYGGRTLMMWC